MASFRAVLAALFVTANAHNVLAQVADPECVTPTNSSGACVSIERCRNIHSIVSDPTNPPSRGVQKYISTAACTLPGVVRSVCCQLVEVVPSTTTANTTATSGSAGNGPALLTGREPTHEVVLDWSLLPSSTCGQQSDNRIAHGNKTRPFEYPWMVVLRYQTFNGLNDKCAGSLINSRYVLTAAHCVKKIRDGKLVKVRLSEHNKATPLDCISHNGDDIECATEAYDVDIEEMIVHKNYGQRIKSLHDIALIRMAQEVEYTDSIQPICLPVDEDVRKREIARYIVTGWGTTENGTSSDVLLQASVKHVGIPECIQKIRENFLAIQLEDPWQLCAIGDDKVDSCSGDSGGPLGFSVPVAGSTKFVQFGIVAAGVGTCGEQNVPGIYTQVSSYIDWIVTNMRP